MENAKPFIVIGSIALGIGLLLLIILLPASFSYVEYDELAFKKNTLTNVVDDSSVFTSGRYFWGPSFTTVIFPANYQRVSFSGSQTLFVFTVNGLEFEMDVSFQYRLPLDNLSQIFRSVGLNFNERISDAAKASIKNSAPSYTADDFVLLRENITEVIWFNLQHDVQQKVLVNIERTKFQILRIRFPPEIESKFLASAVQVQKNQEVIFQGEVNLIRKETEALVSQIRANITLIEQTALAQAAAITTGANALATATRDTATGAGIASVFAALGVSSQSSKKQFMEYFALLDNPESPRVIAGSLSGIVLNQ